MYHNIKRRMIIILLLCLSVTCNIAVAQTGNGCSCPTNERETHTLTVCYKGQECQVSVTWCHRLFVPASTTVACSAGVAVNMYTKIERICFTEGGCEFNCVEEDIISAILCELNPLGGDYWNIKSQIPDCGSTEQYFCWVVALPRCMRRFQPGLCLEPCNAECCLKHYRFCKDPVLGTYTGYLQQDCTAGNSDCQPNDCLCGLACYDWDPMDCPTCP